MTKDEALEQPTQGMKAVSYPKDNKWIDMVEQPAQEPVAWGNPTYNYAVHHKVVPSWQGLSDDEIENIVKYPYGNGKKFARAIEQALRSKNE